MWAVFECRVSIRGYHLWLADRRSVAVLGFSNSSPKVSSLVSHSNMRPHIFFFLRKLTSYGFETRESLSVIACRVFLLACFIYKYWLEINVLKRFRGNGCEIKGSEGLEVWMFDYMLLKRPECASAPRSSGAFSSRNHWSSLKVSYLLFGRFYLPFCQGFKNLCESRHTLVDDH